MVLNDQFSSVTLNNLAMNAKGHTIISRFREAVNPKADILLRSKNNISLQCC